MPAYFAWIHDRVKALDREAAKEISTDNRLRMKLYMFWQGIRQNANAPGMAATSARASFMLSKEWKGDQGVN
jgi:cell division FtsZ-interacting protein ZapD